MKSHEPLYVVTSEYVSPGHPDKIADQISDAILDEYLRNDPHSKVACETVIKDNTVFVAGEITSEHTISNGELEYIVKKTVRDIGYDGTDGQLNADDIEIITRISKQSPEINSAVFKESGIGAGDQGIIFGYATSLTPTKMPPAIYIAKSIIDYAYMNRKKYGYCPDMKAQVTLEYVGRHPFQIRDVVFSTCHVKELDVKTLRDNFIKNIFPKILNGISVKYMDDMQNMLGKINYQINPGGNWNIGGSVSDCGLTGRKIVVDQYGADCEIGGGAFSGKDPSKVDRSGAYLARNIAANIMEKHNRETVKVQLAYSIGDKFPIGIRAFDPTRGDEVQLLYDVTIPSVSQTINKFNLRSPIYLNTAKNGHFGNASYSKDGIIYNAWEKVDEKSLFN